MKSHTTSHPTAFSEPTEGEIYVTLRLGGLSAVELASRLLDAIRTATASIIGDVSQDKPGLIDPERSFRELGLDSLGAVELHRRLTAATGISLPVTAVFEYPS